MQRKSSKSHRKRADDASVTELERSVHQLIKDRSTRNGEGEMNHDEEPLGEHKRFSHSRKPSSLVKVASVEARPSEDDVGNGHSTRPTQDLDYLLRRHRGSRHPSKRMSDSTFSPAMRHVASGTTFGSATGSELQGLTSALNNMEGPFSPGVSSAASFLGSPKSYPELEDLSMTMDAYNKQHNEWFEELKLRASKQMKEYEQLRNDVKREVQHVEKIKRGFTELPEWWDSFHREQEHLRQEDERRLQQLVEKHVKAQLEVELEQVKKVQELVHSAQRHGTKEVLSRTGQKGLAYLLHGVGMVLTLIVTLLCCLVGFHRWNKPKPPPSIERMHSQPQSETPPKENSRKRGKSPTMPSRSKHSSKSIHSDLSISSGRTRRRAKLKRDGSTRRKQGSKLRQVDESSSSHSSAGRRSYDSEEQATGRSYADSNATSISSRSSDSESDSESAIEQQSSLLLEKHLPSKGLSSSQALTDWAEQRPKRASSKKRYDETDEEYYLPRLRRAKGKSQRHLFTRGGVKRSGSKKSLD